MPIRALLLLLACLLAPSPLWAAAEILPDLPPGLQLSVERQPDGSRRALVQNLLAGPVQVRVWVPGQAQTATEATLMAGETRAIGRFPGGGTADLRLLARPYAFPLPADAAWHLTQGFGGRASHRDPANFHALDFATAEGTPVLAARAGTVMQVVDTFREGGTVGALKERMNFVRLLHADGSMGLYAHIATGSARVRPGDVVEAGTALAAVGSVGWSTAPHLHFSVQINDGRELLSLPFRMHAPDGQWLGEPR